jgi:FtsH-binding integral membrane protein
MKIYQYFIIIFLAVATVVLANNKSIENAPYFAIALGIVALGIALFFAKKAPKQKMTKKQMFIILFIGAVFLLVQFIL